MTMPFLNQLIGATEQVLAAAAEQRRQQQEEDHRLRRFKLQRALGDLWKDLEAHATAECTQERDRQPGVPYYRVNLAGYPEFCIHLESERSARFAYGEYQQRIQVLVDLTKMDAADDPFADEETAAAAKLHPQYRAAHLEIAGFLLRLKQVRERQEAAARQQAEDERQREVQKLRNQLSDRYSLLSQEAAKAACDRLQELVPDAPENRAAWSLWDQNCAAREARDREYERQRQEAEQEAAEEAQRQAEAIMAFRIAVSARWAAVLRNREKFAAVQEECNPYVTIYRLRYALVAEDAENEERYLDTQTTLLLSDQPDADGYYEIAPGSHKPATRMRFAFPVSIERLEGQRWTDHPYEALHIPVPEAQSELLCSPGYLVENVKRQLHYAKFEPLPELPELPELDYLVRQAVMAEVEGPGDE